MECDMLCYDVILFYFLLFIKKIVSLFNKTINQ